MTDENGKRVLNDQGEKLTLSVKLERPRVFFATVFNAEQSPLQPRQEQEWSAVARAERILQASDEVIRHSEQNRAFWRHADLLLNLVVPIVLECALTFPITRRN